MSILPIDLVLFALTALLLVYFLKRGRQEDLFKRGGLRLVVAGVTILGLGIILDVTSEFRQLDGYQLVGDSSANHYAMKALYLAAYVLVVAGVLRWLPLTAWLRDADDA